VQKSNNLRQKALPAAGMLGILVFSASWTSNAWGQSTAGDSIPNSQASQSLGTAINPQKADSAQGFPPISPQTFPPQTSVSNSISVSTRAQDLRFGEDVNTIQFDGKLSPTLVAEESQDIGTEEKSQNQSKKSRPFSIYFGSHLPNPTALSGPTRKPIVPASKRIRGGIGISGGAQLNLSKTAKLFLEVKGGESVLGGDLSLFYGSDDLRSGVAFNVFDQRGYSPSFYEGKTKVNLPNGDKPWVDRIGGGIEVRHPFSPHFESTVGVTYQSVSVRDDVFSSKQQVTDRLGNPLTVSSQGRDDLLTINLGLQYDTRNDPKNPIEGTHLRFGLDQSIPTGQANIGMTRLSASASQFFPIPFFRNKKKSVLIVNVQGGHILGDVPPYEAFSLGGDETVRGFQTGAVGTGRSFLEASAEYRFPLFDLKIFKQPIDVGGLLFVDYGSLLGTQNEVIGRPGAVRNKPGDGLGYGLGVQLGTRFGIIRAEVGFNDRGDVEPHLSLGERF
jgi:outer membrane protein insertion porin family